MFYPGVLVVALFIMNIRWWDTVASRNPQAYLLLGLQPELEALSPRRKWNEIARPSWNRHLLSDRLAAGGWRNHVRFPSAADECSSRHQLRQAHREHHACLRHGLGLRQHQPSQEDLQGR